MLGLPAAHADCVPPLGPLLPAHDAPDAAFATAERETRDYILDLDAYVSCVKINLDLLPPLPRKAAYDAYTEAFRIMRDAVDGYNAALAAHEAHAS